MEIRVVHHRICDTCAPVAAVAAEPVTLLRGDTTLTVDLCESCWGDVQSAATRRVTSEAPVRLVTAR